MARFINIYFYKYIYFCFDYVFMYWYIQMASRQRLLPFYGVAKRLSMINVKNQQSSKAASSTAKHKTMLNNYFKHLPHTSSKCFFQMLLPDITL